LSSQIVRKTGQKVGLVLGGFCYAFYVGVALLLGLVPMSDPLYQTVYYFASIVIGVGAALLWTAQGSLVTVMASTTTLGFFNGVFWALFMGNYIVGGLVTQFVLKYYSETVLYAVFSSLAVASVAGLFMIRTTPSIKSSGKQKKAEPFNLLETVKLIVDKKFLFLWPAIAYSGFTSAFYNVIYTDYIGKTWVGFALVVFGICEVLGSVVGGKMSDRVGRTPVFLISCVCTLLGVCFAAMSEPNQINSGTWYYFVSYGFLGLGDSGFNTQVQGALGMYYKNESQPAFAGYRFLLSVCVTIGSIGGRWLTREYLSAPWDIMIPCIILFVNLVLAAACWMYLDVYVAAVSEKKVVEDDKIIEININDE
jgi:MFS family permease